MGKTSTVARLVPREHHDDKPIAPITSADVRADIERLDDEREAAVAAVARLEAGRNAVLLLDDDAKAEAHDAETARQRRAIERCDLKRPGLERTLAEVEAREDAERKEAARVAVEEAIAEVLADLNAEYVEPAKRIAAFLERYGDANRLAEAAGVDTIDRRIRFRPGVNEPDRVEQRLRYLDERGIPTDQAYAPGTYSREDSEGFRYNERGIQMPKRKQALAPVTVRGRQQDPAFAGVLPHAVNLPGARLDDEGIWVTQGQDPAQPPRTRTLLP